MEIAEESIPWMFLFWNERILNSRFFILKEMLLFSSGHMHRVVCMLVIAITFVNKQTASLISRKHVTINRYGVFNVPNEFWRLISYTLSERVYSLYLNVICISNLSQIHPEKCFFLGSTFWTAKSIVIYICLQMNDVAHLDRVRNTLFLLIAHDLVNQIECTYPEVI